MKTLPKNRNYRVTPQRKIVLEEIQKVCTHPTAQEVFQMVQKVDPTIGLTTVYRSLDFLEKQNLILKLQSKNKEARYDGNPEKHCHLFCKKCGAVQDIFDVSDVKITSNELKKSGFTPEFDFLELHGICKNCIS